MRYLILILSVFTFYNCENKYKERAADNAQDVRILTSDFNFELVGEVTDKMKTVTSIKVNKKGNSTDYQILNGFEANVQENEQVIIEDLNFDGYSDIRLLQYLPETANIPFFYWLYDSEREAFERNMNLEIIQSPSLDFENEYILSQWTDESDVRGTDYYKFVGSSIKLMKQETEVFIDSVNYIFTIKEVFGDSLQVTKQEQLKREKIIQ